MKTVTPVLYRDKITDTIGTIKIRISENRKSKYINLKIRLHEKYWNDNTLRVRKTSDIDYSTYNQKIEAKIKELEAVNNNPELVNNIGTSLINFHKKIINRTVNEGTAIKHITVHKKLTDYLESIGKKDILFSEFDTDFICAFKKYMLNNLAENTANHYLKMLKSVLNKAAKEKLYHYLIDPFLNIEFTKSIIRKIALDEKQIQKLINLNISTGDRLHRIKTAFLTQIFTQGMRVSDLLLLRWGSYDKGYITYKMFKTDRTINVYVTENLWTLLIIQVKEFVKKKNIKVKGIEKLEAELIQLQAKADAALKALGIVIDKVHDRIKPGIFDMPEFQEIADLQEQIRISYKNTIGLFANSPEYKDCFIFDFLSDEDLKGINLAKLAGEPYKKVYRLMKNKTIVYNRNLKELQALAKINTTLTTHIARHTFASLSLNTDGINLYDISQSLGHTDIKITQVYLSGFDSKRLETLNIKIANKFSF
jgi:integrase